MAELGTRGVGSAHHELHAQWTDLIGFTRSLSEAATFDEVQSTYMSSVHALLPARSFAIYRLDPDSRNVVSLASEGASDFFISRYESRGRSIDPLLEKCRSEGLAAHSSRLMGYRSWLGHPIYEEVMALHRWRMVLEVPVLAENRLIGTLNFADPDPATLAGDDEIARAIMVAQIVGMAISRIARSDELEEDRDHLLAAFEMSETPMVATNYRTGRQTFNRSAREVLARVAPNREAEWFETAMATSRLVDDEASIATGVADSDENLQVVLRSLHNGSSSRCITTLLLLDDLTQEFDLPAPIAGGLSSREREVATLAARGMRDNQIASVLLLSRHTVRQHLKSVYRKTGVGSRTSLAHLIFQHQGV